MTFWLKPQSPGPIWRFFSSIWLAVGLMLWVGVVCILGTVLGVQEAEIVFFKAWWLSAILGALMLNLTICTLNRSSKPLFTKGELTFPWRLSQMPFLLVHLGLLTVFSAKIITNVTLLDAQLQLSERPPTLRQLPPHEDDMLMLKKRTIIARAIPARGLEDTYVGSFVEYRTAKGEQLRGWVREQENGQFRIKREDTGQVEAYKKEEIHSLVLAQAHPVFLNHLETTEDLQGRTPYALTVGIMVSLIFLVLAYLAGRFFSDGSAPLITGIVFGFLVIALYLEMPTWQLGLFRDRYTLTYKKYYPHANMIDVAGEGLDPNPAIRYRFNSRETWLFYEEQDRNLRINEEQVFSTPLNQGPIEVHYLRFDNDKHREAYLAQAAQGSEGTLVLRNRRDPSRSLRIPIQADVVGRAYAFAGHQIRISKVYKDFRIRQAENAAGPSPESRPSTETYDAGELKNPAIEIKISDEMTPRYDFAWFPGLRRRLNQSVAPHPVIDYRYERPRPFTRPAIAFTRYADSGRFSALVLDKEGPAREFPLEVGEDSDDVEVTMSGGTINLGITRAFENFEAKRELVPVTGADRENWEDYPDAVFVEVVDNEEPSNKASGWLRFQNSLALRVGNAQMLLKYQYQRKKLPFKLRLDSFQVITHPGTNNPSEFRSEVTVLESEDGSRPKEVDSSSVYMNHTYDRDGYRFFQSSYMMPPGQPKVSIFSVAKDPGTKPFYAGCIILCFGVMTIFFVKPSLIKIEKRRARIAAGLPAEGPISKEDLAAAKARNAKDKTAAAPVPKAKAKDSPAQKTTDADKKDAAKTEADQAEESKAAKTDEPKAEESAAEDKSPELVKAEAEAAKAEAEAAKAEAEAAKAEAALAKAEAAKAKAEAAKAKAEAAKAAAAQAEAEAAKAEAEAAEAEAAQEDKKD